MLKNNIKNVRDANRAMIFIKIGVAVSLCLLLCLFEFEDSSPLGTILVILASLTTVIVVFITPIQFRRTTVLSAFAMMFIAMLAFVSKFISYFDRHLICDVVFITTSFFLLIFTIGSLILSITLWKHLPLSWFPLAIGIAGSLLSFLLC